jgi:PII-like signaling protein
VKSPEEGHLLRIYVGESDRWQGKPLYEAIVLKAREIGVAGATVLRGIMGYGAASRIHSSKILRLSEDLPVVIEIVDNPQIISQLLPEIERMVQEGLVTIENVGVLQYRTGK